MNVPTFRSTKQVELWSTKLLLRIPYDHFKERMIKFAKEQKGCQRITGFVTFEDDSHKMQDDDGPNERIVTSFTRTRYPRLKYGVSSVVDCEVGTSLLLEELEAKIDPIEKENVGIRIVLGLVEGYDTTAPQHTVEEVAKALPSHAITVSSAHVFAMRHDRENGTYTEPVAVVHGPVPSLDQIKLVADQFQQERFSVENFDDKSTYLIETRHCTEPDMA